MATDDRPTSSRERPFGVADVVRMAGRMLDAVGLVWLEGEVAQTSNRLARGSAPGGGHVYFALTDKGSVLSAVMWASSAQRLRFTIEPGQRLRVRGRLGVYDRDGKMQLYVDFAEPAGLGADALALEQLKQKLAAEGMFAAAKKRPLPRFPRRIGVVTSAKGAAIHDIIRTIHRRMPTPILIADAAVQGPLAPAQLVQGMAMVVRAGVDVLIIGRGGGSAMDLTAFNHERVVRTISRCPVPVISAVGHETDLSLADLAADVRVSTPTAAAEHAVPDRRALVEIVRKERARLDREMRHAMATARQDLDRAAEKLVAMHPRARLQVRASAIAELAARANVAMQRRLDARHAELGRLGAQMAALSPLAVLDRGYAVARTEAGALVRDVAQVATGDRIALRVAKGELVAVVEKVGR